MTTTPSKPPVARGIVRIVIVFRILLFGVATLMHMFETWTDGKFGTPTRRERWVVVVVLFHFLRGLVFFLFGRSGFGNFAPGARF